MLAPKPFTKPRADNPQRARALYEHKLNKRWPYEARGYDREFDADYHIYGVTLRESNKPCPRVITRDTDFFYLQSQQMYLGEQTYTFIHHIIDGTFECFRALLFTNFSDAYRYAIAHGCHINKRPSVRMSLLDYLQADTEDVDMFVANVETGIRVLTVKPKTNGGINRKGYNYGIE